MSYISQANDSRRRTKALVGVGVIHAAIGYGLLTGLTIEDIETLVDPPLIGEQFPLPPPPPAPTPTPTAEVKKTKPVVPETPFPLPQTGPVLESDPFPDDTIIGTDVLGGGSGDGVVRPIDPPRPPAFTPKGARPSNDKTRWITTDDYPRGPLTDHIEGTAGYRLSVGANGRVSDCQIVTPSGSRALDTATCRYLTSRARFEAATDETGAKVAGTYTGSVRWEIPD